MSHFQSFTCRHTLNIVGMFCIFTEGSDQRFPPQSHPTYFDNSMKRRTLPTFRPSKPRISFQPHKERELLPLHVVALTPLRVPREWLVVEKDFPPKIVCFVLLYIAPWAAQKKL